MTVAPESNTRLRPPWVHLARVAWIIIGVASITLFIIGLVTTTRAPLPSCIGSQAACAPAAISREDAQTADQMGLPFPFIAVSLVFSVAARLSLVVVGLIIFWRRSDDWVALMLSASLMTALIEGGFGNIIALNLVMDLLYTVGGALFFPLPFVFPNGRCEPRWTGRVVGPLTVAYAFAVFVVPFAPSWSGLNTALTLLWTGLSVYALAYRYFRVSNAVERQQTKWVLLGLLAIFIVGIDYAIIGSFFPVSQPSPARVNALLINLVLYLAGYGFFAFSMGVAMLRYRLWDIDRLIRRTLTYSMLSALLALTYFGSVVVLQNILIRLTGRAQSQLVTVVSTLAIAALFFPLRRRVQDFIDRRFYRRKYDAVKTLAAFASAARDETDLDRLTARLVEVVGETMQPESMRVWLKPMTDNRVSRAASAASAEGRLD